MEILLLLLIVLVALMHFGFLLLEMVFWTKPLGRKVFRMTPEQAQTTKALALNQGLYNGFLAAGLLWAAQQGWIGNWGLAAPLAIFFLSCVVVAGIVGALTVSRRIFFVQAVPALIAVAVLCGHLTIV